MDLSESATPTPAATAGNSVAKEPGKPANTAKTEIGEKIEGGFVVFELLMLLAEIFADL